MTKTSALVARGVRLKRGSREILRGVDLHAEAGELVALMGLSGSGKTTMLRVIAGLEPRDAGEVSAAKVGMVFQFHFLFEHLCAIDNVTLAPIQVLGVSMSDARQRAQQLLDQLGVGHRAQALAARVVGRRSAARGDRARAGGRSAALAARRADGVARSRAPKRSRRGAVAAREIGTHAGHDVARRRLRARLRDAGSWCWRMGKWWSRAIRNVSCRRRNIPRQKSCCNSSERAEVYNRQFGPVTQW